METTNWFNHTEPGVVGYVCVNCDAYTDALDMRFVFDDMPASNRTDEGGEKFRSMLVPQCPTCGAHVTGMDVKIGKDAIILPDYTGPRIPKKVPNWTKTADGKWKKPVGFITEKKYRIKSYDTGKKKWVRDYETGRRKEVPVFAKKTKAELLALNTGADGNPISNTPMEHWRMLGYVTNISVVPHGSLLDGREKAAKLIEPMTKSWTMAKLGRISNAAREIERLFGNVTIRTMDLRKLISFGAGLVRVRASGIYHGEKSGMINTHRKEKKWRVNPDGSTTLLEEKPIYLDLDRYTKALENYHNGELSMDRGRATNKVMRDWILRDSVGAYLDTGGINPNDVVDDIIDHAIASADEEQYRVVPYLDEMDSTSNGAKPHAE